MTREAFLMRLRRALGGAPPKLVAEILGDYENYFAEGLRSGRPEAELVEGLGDPGRLASELRLAAGLKRWRDERSLATAARVAGAALALGIGDLLVAAPLAATFLVCAAGPLAAFCSLVWGGFIAVTAMIDGASAATLLDGLGLIGAAIALGAASALALLGLARVIAWYARLHGRAFSPLLPSKTMEPT